MEAVPRLPMLSCELKISPSNTDFGPALKKYIQEFYHEDGESYNKEIKELESLRQSAGKVPRDFTGCRILKRYYSQLHSLQSRFPMSEDGAASVPFMWSDIYSGITFNITDIRYEQACVLYNIGALHSELGATDGRSNAEGMKVSCTHFQCAAWAFQHLRETYPQPKGSDMSHDLLTFFITLMLAQAQECILEKSMLDSRKSTITAKLAAQVVDYYKSALATLVSGSASGESGCILDIIGSKNFKHWKKFLEFKMLYYGSLSHLYMGNQAEEQQQMGERVAWYQSAIDKHGEAIKLAKTMDRDDIIDALTFTLDVIGAKYNAAKKENDFVYHEKVQAAETLPEIKGASLVKGIPFSTSDPDISGPDIFVRLVPMEAHEASSVYSEEKAKLLRQVAAKIENKNQELVTYLTSLKLDRNLLMPKEEKIPQELLEKCAALSVRTNVVEDLTAALNAVMDVYEEVNSSLKEAEDLLVKEEDGERLYQETFEKRAPSLIIWELNKELTKYKEAHKRASESNSTLQKALSMHVVNLQLLSGPLDELQKSLPSINLMDTPNDESVILELQQLLDKVDEMRQQRTMLESQLRDTIQNDDITKQLVTRDKKESLDKFFEEELKKHDKLVGYLDQNLGAQDNILRALTQANARYADTRKAISEIMERRENKVASLLNSYAAYEDLIAKAQKGLEFYRKLQTNVSKLLARVRSVTLVQEEERKQIVQAHAKKMGKKASTAIVTEGPKLKDYLPYMTPNAKGVPELHGSLSSAPLPQSNDGPKLKDYWSYSGPGSHRSTPQASIPSSTSPMPITNNWKSEFYSVPSTVDTSSVSSAVITSMGVRPAPVGSEQTGVTANCMSYSQAQDSKNAKDPEQWRYSPAQPLTDFSSFRHDSQSPQIPVSVPYAQHPLVSQYSGYASSHQQVPHPYSTSYVPPTTLEGMSSQSTYSANRTAYSNIPTSMTSVSSPTTSTAYGGNRDTCEQGSYYQHNDNYRKYTFSQQPGDWATSSVYTCKDNSIVSSVHGVQPEQYPTQQSQPNIDSFAVNKQISQSTVPSAMKEWTGSNPYSASSQNIPVSINTVSQQSVGYQANYPKENASFYTSVTTHHWPSQYQDPVASGTVTTAWNGQTFPTSAISQQWTGQMQSSTYPYQQNQQWSGNMPATSIGSQQLPGQIQQPSSSQMHWSGQIPANSSYTSNVQKWPSNNQQTSMQSTLYTNDIGNANWTGQVQGNSNTNAYLAGSGTNLPWAGQAQETSSTGTNMYLAGSNEISSSANSQLTGQVQHLQPAGISTEPTGQVQQMSTNTQLASSTNMQWSGQLQQMSNVNVPLAEPTQLTSSVNVPWSGQIQPALGTQWMGSANLQPATSVPQSSTVPLNQWVVSEQTTVTHTTHANVVDAPISSINPEMISNGVPLKPVQASELSQPNSASSSPSHVVPQPSHEKKDLLTKIPNGNQESSSLQPMVKSLSELCLQKEEKEVKDPLSDSATLQRFVADVEKFEKFVEGLTRKTLNGPTPLDQKWKEVMDTQEKETRKLSISVARCYPLKNRFPDIMPYDNNRVAINLVRNDYINASYVKDILPKCPNFIVTQAPLSSTIIDFWVMIWEQQVEIILCLLSIAELKGLVYWPQERGQQMTFGPLSLSIQSTKCKQFFTEYIINMTHNETRTSRVVVHLQFLGWSTSTVPESPSQLLLFIQEFHGYHKQQRNLQRPVVVHCSGGVGRSGVFCLLSAAIKEMGRGNSPPELSHLASRMSQQRKFLLQEKEQLKFSYDAALYYAQDILMKRGILTNKARGTHTRHPSEDFILGGSLKLDVVKSDNDTKSSESATPPEASNIEGTGTKTISTDEVQRADTCDIDKHSVGDSSENLSELPNIASAVENQNDHGPTSSITSLLDPATFTLDPIDSPGKRRITKDSFKNPPGLTQSSNDPLSLLDPMWSLKKNKD